MSQKIREGLGPVNDLLRSLERCHGTGGSLQEEIYFAGTSFNSCCVSAQGSKETDSLRGRRATKSLVAQFMQLRLILNGFIDGVTPFAIGTCRETCSESKLRAIELTCMS